MGARPRLSMVWEGVRSRKSVNGGWAVVTVGQPDPFVVGGGDSTCSQHVSCWAFMGAGGHTLPWVDGCGGRVCHWWWGLDIQPACLVLGVHGCCWVHITVSQWLWWKSASLVVGTQYTASASHVGRTWVLVGACHGGSMAVVEGHIIGGGDSTCSQHVSCWVYMGAGGCTSLWVNGCGGRARRWWWGLMT